MNFQEPVRWAQLPDEVLVNLFLLMDAEVTVLEHYREVCKRWAALIRQPELWKRLCHLRWQNNPSNLSMKDNLLIPRLNPNQSEVAWREVYLIRDLSEKMTDALFDFVAVNKEDDTVEIASKEDFFALGWISIDGARALRDKIISELDKVAWRQALEHLTIIIEFICRLELTMAENTGTYFLTEVQLLETFCTEQKPLIESIRPNDALLLRIAKCVKRLVTKLFEAAAPVEDVNPLLESSTRIKAKFVTEDLLRINFETLAYCIDYAHSKMNLEDWATFEPWQLPVNELIWTFDGLRPSKQLAKDDLAMQVLKEIIDKLDLTTRHGQWTAMSLCAKSTFAYFKVTNDPYIAAPMLWYYKSTFFDKYAQIWLDHTSAILKVLSELLTMPHTFVQFYCCTFLQHMFDLNRMLKKKPELLAPHYEALVDNIAPMINNVDSTLRQTAMIAINGLVTAVPELFSKKKDAIIRCHSTLEMSTVPDEVTVAQESILTIGAKVADNDCFVSKAYSLFTTKLETYLSVTTTDNAAALISVTPRCITIMPRELLEKHFQQIFPVIIFAAWTPFEADEGDDDEFGEANLKVVDMRKYALKSISALLKKFDREYLTSCFQQIKQTLAINFETHFGLIQVTAAKALAQLIQTFFVPNMESNWSKQIPDLITEACELVNTALAKNSFKNIQEKVVRSFNTIIAHLARVSPASFSAKHGTTVMGRTVLDLIEHVRPSCNPERVAFGEEVIRTLEFVLEHCSVLVKDLVYMFEQIASDFEHYDRNKLYLQLRMAQLAIIRFGNEMETTEASKLVSAYVRSYSEHTREVGAASMVMEQEQKLP